MNGIWLDFERPFVELEKKIEEKIRNVLSIGVEVKLVELGEIPRSTGKAKRVVDLRSGKM